MPSVKFDTDVAQALRAHNDLADAIEGLADGYNDSAKAARGLEKAADRIVRSNEGPQERYNRKMAELAKLVKAGKLSMDDAEKAAARYRMQMERVGAAGEKALGPSMLGNIGKIGVALGGLSGAIAGIKQILTDVENRSQGAADSLYTAYADFGEMQQISKSPEEFAANVAEARTLVQRGIVGKDDYKGATAAVTNLRNAGFSDEEREFLYGLADEGQVKGESLVDFGGSLRKSQAVYGGKISLQKMADRIKRTSVETMASASETAKGTVQFSASAEALGYSGDDVLAAFALVDEKSKDINDAGVKLGALFRAIDAKGLDKGTIDATLDFIKSQKDAGKTEYELLGDSLAVTAYRNIQTQREMLGPLSNEIGRSDGSFEASRFIDKVPELRAMRQKRRSEGALADSDAAYSEKETLMDTVGNELFKARRDQGFTSLDVYVRSMVRGALDKTGDEDLYFKSVKNSKDLTPETQLAVQDYLRRTAEAAERTAKAAEASARPSGSRAEQ